MPANDSAVAKDIGFYIHPEHGDSDVSGVAAGAGDNVEATGGWVQVPEGAQSAAMVINWSTVLTATQTFSLSANAQDATSAAGANAADYKALAAEGADGAGKQTLTPTVVATGGAGGTTVTGTTTIRFPDIRSNRGFLASQVTGDLSAGAADTFNYGVVWIFGGMARLPGNVTNVTSNA